MFPDKYNSKLIVGINYLKVNLINGKITMEVSIVYPAIKMKILILGIT